MIARVTTVLALAALALAGCGGSDKTKTIVRTVVKTEVAAPTTPTVPTATETTDTTTAPAETPDPVADLPAGTPALQGEFDMTVKSSRSETFIDVNEDEGDERKWFATMRCDGERCTVDLRRELPQGGFKTVTLRQDGDDRRRYAANSTGGEDVCTTIKPAGPPAQRLSVRVTGTQDVAGQETATRLDGYLTVRQTCKSPPNVYRPKAVVMFRGGRPYRGSTETPTP